MDYTPPFTLLPTFFDAHDKMEFEYRNNYVVVEGDCQMVATSDAEASNKLKIFPNPTSKELHIQIEQGRVEQVRLYSVLGERLRSRVLQASAGTLSVDGLTDGVYLLEVELSGGQRIWRKVLVQR